PHLQKLTKENVKLLGHQPDNVVTDMLNRAKAFVYMATEDFGIAMVEAQAAGCPVIAYGKGGAAEIVRDGETGLLFPEQTAQGLVEAVRRFEGMELKSEAARENATRFSRGRFQREFSDYMGRLLRSGLGFDKLNPTDTAGERRLLDHRSQ
ncbi:MAG TPA: glycosyltransferase, partial [Anaerolineales bacterium]|nr:glycosyltransferase [Anaerolineales bacterium]